MWAFSWSRNYFRRYCHTAKPCLYHWRLFRRREIYTRRFREASAGWLRDHSEYISCTCKNETLLKCSIFVNNFISAIKQYGRLSPWTEARERLHKNFKIKNSKYWSFERKTDSLNFFLKLKAPQCKANGLFATTLSSHNKLHWPLKLSISIVFIYLEIYNRRKRNRMLTQYWHIHVSHEHGNLFSVGSFICQTGFKTIDCLLSLQRNKITDLNIKIKSTILWTIISSVFRSSLWGIEVLIEH